MIALPQRISYTFSAGRRGEEGYVNTELDRVKSSDLASKRLHNECCHRVADIALRNLATAGQDSRAALRCRLTHRLP
jgi:hypothetical protein